MATVVIGDLHADVKVLHCCLILAGFSTGQDKTMWRANDAVKRIVFLGDYLDRMRYKSAMRDGKTFGEVEDEELQILNTINQIEGCEVVKILGNHEFMNVDGNFAYVTNFSKSKREQQMKQIIDKLLYENHNVKCRVVYKAERMLFCHGQALTVPIEPLNSYAKKRLLHGMAAKDETLEAQLMKLLWGREMSCSENLGTCGLADQVCAFHGCDSIYLGHTPQSMCKQLQATASRKVYENDVYTEFAGPWTEQTDRSSNGISCDCSGKLFKCDVAASRGFMKSSTEDGFISHYKTKNGSHRPQILLTGNGKHVLRVVRYNFWKNLVE